MLSVFALTIIMLNVIMLSVFTLTIVMMNDIMLSVFANCTYSGYAECHYAICLFTDYRYAGFQYAEGHDTQKFFQKLFLILSDA
jgi:hypothetical protein